MPRANRHFRSGHVWHITHRCHDREFLLKFRRDRRCWAHWLFEARKRFGLCVLDYIATCNHVHLLVVDRGRGEIARSMQLIAGRTAQAYNRRKRRLGAYWQDRYHATAVDTDQHLGRCLVYIDLNMVRAGVVAHPAHWDVCGYREIQAPPQRYRIIDQPALQHLLGIPAPNELRRAHADWVAEALRAGRLSREPHWSDSLAVGSEAFVARFHHALGLPGRYREMASYGTTAMLRETGAPYTADSRR